MSKPATLVVSNSAALGEKRFGTTEYRGAAHATRFETIPVRYEAGASAYFVAEPACPPYRRVGIEKIVSYLAARQPTILLVVGPRAVGKSTLVRQACAVAGHRVHWPSTLGPEHRGAEWMRQQWAIARDEGGAQGLTLVFDDADLLEEWPFVLNRLSIDHATQVFPPRVILIGTPGMLRVLDWWDRLHSDAYRVERPIPVSDPFLRRKVRREVEPGALPTPADRFELVYLSHWSPTEMRDAFHWTIDQWVFHGGFPGAAGLIADHAEWSAQVRRTAIEPALAVDSCLHARLHKPALLRALFTEACRQSADRVSYNRLLAALRDAGNTVTLAHYLRILDEVGLASGLSRYGWAPRPGQRKRLASPKILARDPGLISATHDLDFRAARRQPEHWGRLLETAVAAHLLGAVAAGDCELHYWQARGRSVDFVVRLGERLLAIEVCSGRAAAARPGMEPFGLAFNPDCRLRLGGSRIPTEDFFSEPAIDFLARWSGDVV
jgi:uncharacterized protein